MKKVKKAAKKKPTKQVVKRGPKGGEEIASFMNLLRKNKDTIVFLGKIPDELRNSDKFFTLCHVAKRFGDSIGDGLTQAATAAGFANVGIKVLVDLRGE